MITHEDILNELHSRKKYEDDYSQILDVLDIDEEGLIDFATNYITGSVSTIVEEEPDMQVAMTALFCSAFTLGVGTQQKKDRES